MSTPLLVTRAQHEDIEAVTRMDISEVSDRLQAMRFQEESAYRCCNYFVTNNSKRNNNDIPNMELQHSNTTCCLDEECREMMCMWCYQVVDFCDFQRETVSIAFSYLDRYLCTPNGQIAFYDRKVYQLAAMTALYIAVKTHEPVALGLEILISQSRGVYCEEDFRQMERSMLTALQWRVSGPTPLAFVRCFLALLPDSIDTAITTTIMEYSRRQVELAVFDSSSVLDRLPSEIAVAAIVNCIMEIHENTMSLETKGDFFNAVERFSGYPINNTLSTQSNLSRLLVGVLSSEQTGGVKSSSRCAQVEATRTTSTTNSNLNRVSVGVRH